MTSDPTGDTSPDELYADIKAELDRLARNTASRSEWIQLSYKLVDTIMRCQQFVIAKQKAVIAYARGEANNEMFRDARRQSRDAIHILDRLNELHQQIRSRLLFP